MFQTLSIQAHQPSRYTLAPSPGATDDIRTLIACLENRARVAPNSPAFVCLEARDAALISNADFQDASRTLAGRLAAAGIGRGDVVLLALETSIDCVAAFFACLHLSAVPCVVDTPASKAGIPTFLEKMTQKARHVNARLILARENHMEALRSIRLPVSTLEELPEAASVARLPDPEDAAFLQFTSGTTGRAKAILVSHRNLMTNVKALASAGEWTGSDVMVSWLPLYHDMGLVASLLAGFVAGMPVVLMPSNMFTLNPARWMWAIHTFSGTISFAPNFAYQFVATRVPAHRTEGLDLSSWRQAFNAAEFVHRVTVEAFVERFKDHGFSRSAFVPAYGMAECTVATAIRRPTDPLRFDTVSRQQLAKTGRAEPIAPGTWDSMTVACVGQAIDGHRIFIVDENGDPVADRIQGEVVIEGPSVLGGYYQETAANRAFRNNRLYTGDLGYKDGNYLFITGRIKDLIIRAGANLSPYDIERVAAQVDGVRAGATAAVGVRDEAQGTELLVVFFETTLEDPAPVAQAIKQTLVQTLGIMPDHVLPLPPHSVEKTTSGKIRRPELAQKAYEYLAPSEQVARAA